MASSPSIEPLLAKIARQHPDADLTMVRLAFETAKTAHEGQKRVSGVPYIEHPVATAETLADMHAPIPIIIAGLLHDVPEDTSVTVDDIRRDFGDDIASMVAGITKLGKIKYRGIDRYVENLRKMFVAMASDVRVVLIKFADRLHNLSTLAALPPDKRRRVALESLEIYAPIAGRLGMNEIKSRIEDEAFKHAMPKEYEWVSALAERTAKVKQGYIDGIRDMLEHDLRATGVPFTSISGRVKHLYSLYRKLLRHERDIVQVNDLVALRVIVPTVGDCYAALGIIHQRWRPLRDRIKDYIALPKPNGYRSLHTTVFCENGEIVEFQIRTQQMHEEAEYGIAAHWNYDETGKGKMTPQVPEQQLAWVKELAESENGAEHPDSKEYLSNLETLKFDVFQDRIFVFTPQGDVIDLPDGATPVDFAYSIHTQIGDTCVGARVNDEIVALDDKLTSGDCCEIIVDKNRKAPNPDWLDFVKTGTARSHIKMSSKNKLTRWIFDLGKSDKDTEERGAKRKK